MIKWVRQQAEVESTEGGAVVASLMRSSRHSFETVHYEKRPAATAGRPERIAKVASASTAVLSKTDSKKDLGSSKTALPLDESDTIQSIPSAGTVENVSVYRRYIIEDVLGLQPQDENVLQTQRDNRLVDIVT
jgi:hypothetical protein